MGFCPLDLEESDEVAKREVGEAGEREDRENGEKEGEMDRPGDTPITKEEETTAGAEVQKAATNQSKQGEPESMVASLQGLL